MTTTMDEMVSKIIEIVSSRTGRLLSERDVMEIAIKAMLIMANAYPLETLAATINLMSPEVFNLVMSDGVLSGMRSAAQKGGPQMKEMIETEIAVAQAEEGTWVTKEGALIKAQKKSS